MSHIVVILPAGKGYRLTGTFLQSESIVSYYCISLTVLAILPLALFSFPFHFSFPLPPSFLPSFIVARTHTHTFVRTFISLPLSASVVGGLFWDQSPLNFFLSLLSSLFLPFLIKRCTVVYGERITAKAVNHRGTTPLLPV